ncbi:ArsR/SmtB family transcription factor [Streptacidiphilus rugosus]|uniref:ArsR/SmtB family transcription factor n=1 Tax=Streptacidiphilus rugosus TaxID=405783 RepID=UPI000568C2B1|nr:winged helix-turn-helix domain-containing protein [Streptacidiphilus rugosus]
MLRVHFTPEDLLGVRFARTPAPLVEALLALTVVRAGSRDPAVAHWRRSADAQVPAPSRRLLELLRPSDGLGPVFLDPPLPDPDDAVGRAVATPPTSAAAELHRVAPPSPWSEALARGDARAWRELELSLTALNRGFLPRWWPRIQAGFAADVAWRSQVLVADGLRAMLTGLTPGASWAGSELRLPGARDADVRLHGQGVTLLPSLLWRGAPLRTGHPDGSLVLVYPALTPLPLVPPPDSHADPLAALLGPTRAQVLHLLAQPQTTGGLARRLGISAATASGHAKTLRAAGLVTTAREGKFVHHTCTTLGTRLLAGG